MRLFFLFVLLALSPFQAHAANECWLKLIDAAKGTQKNAFNYWLERLIDGTDSRFNEYSVQHEIMSVVPEFYRQNRERFNFKTSREHFIGFDDLSQEQFSQVMGTMADDIENSKSAKKTIRKGVADIVRGYTPVFPTRIPEPTFSKSKEEVSREIRAAYENGKPDPDTVDRLFREYRLILLKDRDGALLAIEKELILLRKEIASDRTITSATQARDRSLLVQQKGLHNYVIDRLARDNDLSHDSEFIRDMRAKLVHDQLEMYKYYPVLPIEKIREGGEESSPNP